MPHTPGPWTYDPDYPCIYGNQPRYEDDEDKQCLVMVVNLLGAMGGNDTKADCRLMVAAPDLLEALELAMTTIERLAPDGSRATQGTADVVYRAISKAKGIA